MNLFHTFNIKVNNMKARAVKLVLFSLLVSARFVYLFCAIRSVLYRVSIYCFFTQLLSVLQQ